MNNSQFENTSVGKLLFKFSLPAIVGLLVNALYNIVDRFFIGQMKDVGAVALSGISVTFPIAIIIMSFGMLVGTGASARMSIALGENNEKGASQILGNAFVLDAIFSVILTILGLLFYKPILMAFGATPEIIGYASDYIVIIMGGIIFSNTAFAMNACIRAQGFATVSMFTLLIGAVINIILDPILIFGFNMGVKGAGWATVIAQFVSALWTLKFLMGNKTTIRLKTKEMKVNPQVALSIFAIGMSPFAMQMAAAMVEVLFNRTLNIYAGPLGIGVYSTINSLIMLFLMPVIGINQGSQPMVGYYYGSKNYPKLKETYWKSTIAATVICLIGFAAFQLIPAVLLGVFNQDPEFLELGVYGMRILTFMVPILGFQILSSNFFQATGKAAIAMFLSLLRQVIVLVPLILILPKLWGLQGVWVTTPISDFISTLLTAFFIIKIFKSFKVEEQKVRV